MAVNYHTPTPVTFYSAMVNVDHSTIDSVVSLADHPGLGNLYFVDADGHAVTSGFNVGDVVTYKVSSGTAGVTGTAIGGPGARDPDPGGPEPVGGSHGIKKNTPVET